MSTTVRQRPLGTSGLHLTTIGFGTWAMGGGDWKFGWGAQDDAESIRAIQAGLDAGINWLDTAAIYGHGHSEEIVAKAIAGRRDEVIVATKCGRVWEGDSREIGKRLRRESVLAECDASLRRLRVDAIDLYQIHWPEPDEQVEEGRAARQHGVEERHAMTHLAQQGGHLERRQRRIRLGAVPLLPVELEEVRMGNQDGQHGGGCFRLVCRRETDSRLAMQ